MDVWTFEIDGLADAKPALRDMLSAAERERPDRVGQFVVTRGVLRLLLARRLGAAPAEIEIVDDERGKPRVADGAVQFNVSHTRGLGAVAIADRPVGVDVEVVKPRRQLDGIAARILSDEERREFEKLGDGERVERFYALWTEREALAKGLGTGLAFVLERGSEERDWRVESLSLPDPYRGAVAAPGEWELIMRTLGAEDVGAWLP